MEYLIFFGGMLVYFIGYAIWLNRHDKKEREQQAANHTHETQH